MIKNIKLDTILLLTLVIPFIMGFRISPFTSQYWYFGIVFLLFLLYIVTDLYVEKHSKYNMYKNILLGIVIILVIGGSFISAITTRHKIHPIYQIHDIILQQEAAIRYFLDGKNPYKETYFGTFMEEWHYSDTEVNPALYHFVMEPFYLLFALPFYFISNYIVGYFDGRIPLFSLFFLLLFLAFRLVKDNEKRRLFVLFLAFHPSMLPYTLEGRSDIFMYTFLFAGFFLLYKKNFFLAGIPIGLAFAIKQSAWFIFPFYIFYLYLNNKSLKDVIQSLLGFIIICILTIAPFFFWDSQAFYNSTISYLNGGTEHSYPISGYGFGGSLVELGIIKNKFGYFPFVFWQLLIGLPLLFALCKFIKRRKDLQSVIVSYGIFLFVYWYFSRYFNNSHIAFVSLIFITAYFWPDDNKKDIQKEEKK